MTPHSRTAQALAYARKAARDGELLPAAHATGPYGERFWGRVTLGTPGRTKAECLDAFLATTLAAACPPRPAASGVQPA